MANNSSSFRVLLLVVLAPTYLGCLSSCASKDETHLSYEQRLLKRNEKYYAFNQRRKMRIEARQERTNMWFDRMMH